jgi:cell division protein FtsW (lipid II flippase)
LIPIPNATPIDRAEGRLLNLAALFLGVYCLTLSLAPWVRTRSLESSLAWSHWLVFLVWLVMINLAHTFSARRLPKRDALLLPVAALMTGWGMLTIYRLFPSFGLRQTGWMALAMLIFILGLRLSPDFRFLRRYKYLWLTGGLLLTGLTLFLGTNPLGYGPEMWLGCCGIYLQPSEPLKLLLIIYLAAYLADRLVLPVDGSQVFTLKAMIPLLAPSFIMTGLALLLLMIQRDLGTATIFLFLYAVMVYVASGRKWVVLAAVSSLAAASVAGYLLFDVVKVRVDAWLNPWLDPSGRSFQIVQSLLAVANGGLIGRGPGLGSPGLVPVPHSDFIFSAVFEEMGLAGAIGLIVLIALIANRGLNSALRAPDAFQRYLAAGLTAYLVGQSILIIGGNLRALPLTGVTLPFVSYGGSSLLVSIISLLFLIIISNAGGSRWEAAYNNNDNRPRPILQLGALLLIGLTITAIMGGWWSVAHSASLLRRTDNPRRALSDRYVRRGSLLDRENRPINLTTGASGSFTRQTLYPDLSPIVGYTDPIYGQAGLEASLDGYLRGLQGNPLITLWTNHLLYGQPPPGLDVRTSLDLDLQQTADQLLEGHKGALVLLNAQTGEILAMASHPTFNANRLAELGQNLLQNPDAPLLNRAVQGLYPPGASLNGLSLAGEADERVSPLQMSLAAAAISAGGLRPASQLALAVKEPERGWVILPAQEEPQRVLPEASANTIADSLAVIGEPYWQRLARAAEGDQAVSWFVGGTLPEWNGAPLALAVLLEAENDKLAEEIGQRMLQKAMGN